VFPRTLFELRRDLAEARRAKAGSAGFVSGVCFFVLVCRPWRRDLRQRGTVGRSAKPRWSAPPCVRRRPTCYAKALVHGFAPDLQSHAAQSGKARTRKTNIRT